MSLNEGSINHKDTKTLRKIDINLNRPSLFLSVLVSLW